MKQTKKITTVVATTALFAAAAGCASKSGAEVKGDNLTAAALTDGAAADVTVEVTADGVLYASEIKIQPADESDTDNVECEDGLTHDGQPCADEQDENDEGAVDDDTDNVECEDGLTPDGQPCADGQDGEPSGENDAADEENNSENELVAPVESIADDLSSFTVLGGLTVMVDQEEQDDTEADADTETDAEENDDPSELDISALTVGTWVNVSGEYSETDGVFYADEITKPDHQVIELDGTVKGLSDAAFSMFGLTVTYDSNTSIVPEDDPEAGADQGDENDGIDCQQDGEHEGDNEGC